MNDEIALQAKSIVQWYGSVNALKGVDLSLRRGEVHAIIGPNGAGKSTFFGVLSGDIRPTSGSILVDGVDVSRRSVNDRVRCGIGRTYQVARVFDKLTVFENALVAAQARFGESVRMFRRPGRQAVARAFESLHAVGLEKMANIEAGSLSMGDRKKLEFACVLGGEPQIILFDEPTAGMSATETARVVEIIREQWLLRRFTIALCEHDMSVVFGLADTLTVFEGGRVLCSGAPGDVAQRSDVQQLYLGERAADAGDR